MTAIKTREDWCVNLFELMKDSIFEHVSQWPEIRFSISDLPKSQLGNCYPRSRNGANWNQIHLTAFCDNTVTIMLIMVHEISHALDDCQSGHGQAFKKQASTAGLIAPYAKADNHDRPHHSDNLLQQCQELHSIIGDIPHSKLTRKPQQKGRNNNLIKCGNCGWQANTSAKHIKGQNGELLWCEKCWVCGQHTVNVILN